MGFEDFKPMFGEPKAEWAKDLDSGSVPLRRFLMHVFAPDYYHLKICVTDYHSNTFEAVKSVPQLEDMKDSIGIGGSWSEFVDYIIASIKSEGVKLVLEKHSDLDGAACAKLVAQKSKGMPRISLSLTKLVNCAASDAMEYISFGLFKSFQSMQNFLVQEQIHSLRLTKETIAGKERCEGIQSQLEKRQKLDNSLNNADVSNALSSNGSQNSSVDKRAREPASTKVTNRVVPAYRRAKVRGALLQDTEEDNDN